MHAKSNAHPSPSAHVEITPAAKERAARHYQRALEQLKLKQSSLAVQELRDAVQNDPYNGTYHALLGKIHLDKGLVGMANINLRQALKLNPEEPLALECLQKLRAQTPTAQPPQALTSRLMNFLNRKL